MHRSIAKTRMSMALVVLAATILPPAAFADATSPSAPARCGDAWHVVLGGKGGVDPLLDVDAVSSHDVWAAGDLTRSSGAISAALEPRVDARADSGRLGRRRDGRGDRREELR
jgi:hypothetical protein